MECKHKISPCQIALQLTAEEADALLTVLLSVPATEEVPEEMTAQLLRRLVDAQRAALRPATVESWHEEPSPQHAASAVP